MTHRIAIDWDELEIALTMHMEEVSNYLDLRTGRVELAAGSPTSLRNASITRPAGVTSVSQRAVGDVTMNACGAPGGIETPLQHEFEKMPEGVSWKEFRKVISPLGNSQPEEIANIAIFVASDACRYMTGSIVSIDGGLTI